ncbi:MAG: CotH kinase family protein [Clostridiales bacterium]|jgi:uncharacterized repeat protein (TIGR02543 family)|nr:CotH kinase family protein [Clostridiales bacterium]
MSKKLILCVPLLLFISAAALTACADQTSIPKPDIPVYTIVFETLAEPIPPIKGAAGTEISAPPAPSRAGYRFDGWSLGGAPYIFATMPEENITLLAEWSKLYTITFVTGADGTAVAPITAAANDVITAPPAPKRPHFKFNGWLLGGANFGIAVMPPKDIELTAAWLSAVTISFNTGVPGLTVDAIVELENAPVTAPEAPLRAGYGFDYWTLNGSRYTFSVMPKNDITLNAQWLQFSNLPSVFINLKDSGGNTVPLNSVNREVYVAGTVDIDNTSAAYALKASPMEFRGRGNGSWDEAKKGYRIKFSKKQTLFGHPSSKHWVILACTNFDDRTMAKNSTAFNMARDIFTEIEYTTSTEWVDIYVNGSYRGVYLLCEQVREDENRVDIDSEYGVNDTGYLIEYDAYAAGTEGINYFTVPGVKYPFTVKSPDPDEYAEAGITATAFRAQVNYIKTYTTNLISAALAKNFTRFSMYADVASFVDMYILHELFKNTDTGYSSFFMYKRGGEGEKLHAGPAWDFDATAGASRGDSSTSGIYVAGTVQQHSGNTVSEMYINLYQVPAFKSAVVARWKTVSPDITEFVNARLSDTFIAEHKFAMGRNFVVWPSGNAANQAAAEAAWESNTRALRKWLLDRTIWLNGEWR